jgi:hypothetical protein
MSHFKKWFRIAFSLQFKGSYKMREPGGRFLPFLLGRAAFMGLRVGYNWMQIVNTLVLWLCWMGLEVSSFLVATDVA